MSRTPPIQFLLQVRQELIKVVWPTQKETIITTIMVFFIIFVSSLFFFIIDFLLRKIVLFVLGIGA